MSYGRSGAREIGYSILSEKHQNADLPSRDAAMILSHHELHMLTADAKIARRLTHLYLVDEPNIEECLAIPATWK